MSKVLTIWIILLCWSGKTYCARILGVFPVPGKSHYILGSSLMRALAEKGHDVSVISAFGEKNPPEGSKYRDIILDGFLEEKERRSHELNLFEVGDIHPLISLPFLAYKLSEIEKLTLEHKNVQKLIHSEEKFDAVIIEQFYSDSLKALASHFNGVQIVFSTVGANFWVNSLVGNPAPPAYIPDFLLSFSSNMTFWERLTNSVVFALNVAIHNLYLYPKSDNLILNFISNNVSVYDVLYNASLVLVNSHPSLGQAVPHVPNLIEIGGFHIKPNKKLPQDLQQFLDDATDGFIYFSLGSTLRGADLPTEKREALLKVFSKLKQKVLWKWEEEILPDQPANVKLSSWFPQQDVLAHPNIKAFITHGGLLSVTETIYHGVPVLAIPVFADQKLNAEIAVNSGFGLSIPFNELNYDRIDKTLHELLTNVKYKQVAKKRSKIFHDRPVSAVNTAVYWIEYVIRHSGAQHLRVAGVNLPWYQYHLLDVAAFVIIVTVSALVIIWFTARKIFVKFTNSDKIKKIKKS